MQRTEYGGIAQLGERLNGIQEVSGSIPLISTKTPENESFSVFFFCKSSVFSGFYLDFWSLDIKVPSTELCLTLI